MDAITLLTRDHQAVRELLDQLAESTTRATKKRTDLLSEIAIQLKAHTTIEEEIFYPAFKSAGDKSDDATMYFEALEEHRAAGELVLPDLLDTPTDSEKFSGRAKVLKELVTHHADEEEKGMFKRVKQLMDAAELKELGEKLKARKAELVEQFKAETETRAQAG
jgi:hemerythrin superfamily protein